MATASSERGLSLRSPGRFRATAARLCELYRRHGADHRDGGDGALREAVIQAWIDAEAYHLYTLQTVARLEAGEALGPEASLNKIFWSELDLRMHETALRI